MKIRKLKLYHFPATRSARVFWALHEATDGAFEVEPLNLYGGAQYRPDYLALNPNHSVPLLEITWEDSCIQTMIESAAMIAFLADAYPEAGLAPPPGASPERADYLQMLHFGGTQLDMMLWQIRIHKDVISTDEADPRVVSRYLAKFTNEGEPQLAARLNAHAFICGDAFTAADCIIGYDIGWARSYGLCRDAVFSAYLSRVSKRPAYRKAFADAKTFNPKPPESRGAKFPG